MELFFSVIKMIVFLVVIIYAINWSLKYLNPYTNQPSDAFQVLQRLSVSKASSLALVKMLDQYYLMSLSEQQNQIIKILTPEEVAAYQAKNVAQTTKPVPNQFSDLVNKSMKQLSKKKEEAKHENHKIKK